MPNITDATEKSVNTANAPTPCDKPRILIVDDEKMICDVFRTVLSFGIPNCRVDAAINGAEAVRMFRDVHHVVILMDLRMPVMDGETAFREIEKICREENIQMPSIVFCTGFVPSDEIRKIIANSRIHGLLRKPISNDVLVETLKSKLLL